MNVLHSSQVLDMTCMCGEGQWVMQGGGLQPKVRGAGQARCPRFGVMQGVAPCLRSGVEGGHASQGQGCRAGLLPKVGQCTESSATAPGFGDLPSRWEQKQKDLETREQSGPCPEAVRTMIVEGIWIKGG